MIISYLFRTCYKTLLKLEVLLEPFGVGTAYWNLSLLSVSHLQLKSSIEPRNHLYNFVDVDKV